MIRFDFTVSEEEAQSIFECISKCIEDCHTTKMEFNNPLKTFWLDRHIKYLEELKAKMKNARVT